MTIKKTIKKPQRVIAVGNKILVRLVTNYFTGRVIFVGRDYALLEDAAWIACTQRWHDTLKNGDLEEVEPCIGIVEIGLGALVDAHYWNHDLPRDQK